MQSKARGSFPTERIKVIIDTDPKAFKKGAIKSPDLCFQVAYCSDIYTGLGVITEPSWLQVGDEKEILYLIA